MNLDDPPERVPLPDDTVIVAELTITSYFGGDGLLRYGVHIGGDPNLAQALGLCELAKKSIITVYEENNRKDDDDTDI